MSLRRAIFSVTCDANGQGTTDASLKSPSTLNRHAQVSTVTIDTTSATALGVLPNVALNELDDTTAIAVPVTAEATGIGRQLFFLGSVQNTADEHTPRRATTDLDGLVSTTVVGATLIRTKKVRCTLTGGAPLGVYTVTMYYDTAGDYRF